ncbi:MAG: AI-2E family transporter [Marinoscillum sp.]
MTFSYKNGFYALALVVLIVFVIWIARTLLVPLAFGLLFALVLFPLVRKLQSTRLGLVGAIIISMTIVVVGVSGLFVFFSTMLVSVADEFKNFQSKLVELGEDIIVFLNEKVPFISDLSPEMLTENLGEFFSNSGFSIVSGTISKTGTFLTLFLLTFLYTFLILLYHKNLTEASAHFVEKERRPVFVGMLKKVQKVGQQYLTGMILLILVLGVLNSIGLLLIGLDYAIFFGFFAAVMAIIPYVGTTLGGLIPTFYAFMTHDNPWFALVVVAVFWFVQTLEGNVLSPYIVGSNLNLNALSAIIALIAGGLLWGLPGMVLALPFAAILKVFFDHYESTKPLALLMADQSGGGKFAPIEKVKHWLSKMKQ